ncbi:hypothetical protein BV25DRAFT_1996438 [Artomyces pyxidatus]|uniref:Uncharacterized protein n=1 Tax=Artomyces pyxidatus TaxID=48021 RepID=A0ACB8SCV8_9AGAM|nr:hypothetical protein BV25DRAFT_1996438 [Artomyces pyxidatus]
MMDLRGIDLRSRFYDPDIQAQVHSEDFGGIDVNAIMDGVLDKLRPGPITGLITEDDIIRAMRQNMTPALLSTFEKSKKVQERLEAVDLSSYDFASLTSTIQPNVGWVVEMKYSGMMNASKKIIDPETAHHIPAKESK